MINHKNLDFIINFLKNLSLIFLNIFKLTKGIIDFIHKSTEKQFQVV